MHENLLNYVPSTDLLKGRVIIVTGAASGIGRASAEAYARFGATVVLVDKQSVLLNEAYDEILAAGFVEPLICELDLAKADQQAYQQLIQLIAQELGRLDGVLLNAAWLGAFMPIKQHDSTMWDQMLAVNLTAPFRLLQACLPLLEQADDPAIIFSSDTTDKPYYGAYGVSKAGLNALASILAQEYNGSAKFIRVNSINTGPLRTRLRTLNFPGEHAATLALPQAVVGPYLYFMGPDAQQRSQELIELGRLPASIQWPGANTHS